MAKAKHDYDWTHTANVLCLIANIHRPAHSPPMRPHMFHPSTAAAAKSQAPISTLKVFLYGHQ